MVLIIENFAKTIKVGYQMKALIEHKMIEAKISGQNDIMVTKLHKNMFLKFKILAKIALFLASREILKIHKI